MLKYFLDWVFPRKCVTCGQEGKFICEKCFAEIKLSKSPVCRLEETCGLIQQFYIPCEYHGNKILKKSVHLMKYRFYKDIAENLAQLFIDLFKKNPPPAGTLLVPIPLHKKRHNYRGFNQAHELAKHISAECKMPICNDLLVRVKDTRKQAESTKSERIENMKNAFAVNAGGSVPETSKILLVDDICTTLSTLKEAALALQKNGYTIIFGAALARAEMYAEIKKNYDNRH